MLRTHHQQQRSVVINNYKLNLRAVARTLQYRAHGGFLGGASGKEPICQGRRYRKLRFDPRVRKIPWRWAWQPSPVFLPGESHGQRSPVGYRP